MFPATGSAPACSSVEPRCCRQSTDQTFTCCPYGRHLVLPGCRGGQIPALHGHPFDDDAGARRRRTTALEGPPAFRVDDFQELAFLRGAVRFRFWTLGGRRWTARATELQAFAVRCGCPDADQVEVIECEPQTFCAYRTAPAQQEGFDGFGSASAEPPPRRIGTAGGLVLSSRLTERRMLRAAHLYRRSSKPDVILAT